ncbi:MAG: hypothetical protein IJX25_04645 [Clostridia bacterium]|nr:hypothetical protein [Clostridia bacterium]MBQ8791994.1 hypothetical protein [Clostridia bacterium]
MNYQISQRIQNIMDSDKICNPQSVCRVLEEEFKPIVENYLSLSKDFKVRFKKDKDKNIFFLELEASRIKPFGYIPN